MLSCLVQRFNQETGSAANESLDDNIMPAKFALQFPSINGTSAEKSEDTNVNDPSIKDENSSEASTTPPLHGEYDQELTPRPASVTMSSNRSSPTPSTSSNGGRYDTTSPHSSAPMTHACSNCSSTFPSREQLEKHELMHSPGTGTVSCTICSKQFANVYRLQRHMLSHDESDDLRKFKCTDCDKAFKFKHHLKEHLRIHSGEKPFGCPNCGKRFSHSGSFSSHMTSKKCISMGLKMNGAGQTNHQNHRSSHNNNNNSNKQQKQENLLTKQQNRYLSNEKPPPPFLSFPNGYENAAAAFFASLPNPFLPIPPLHPVQNPFSIQRLLEKATMESFLNANQNNNNNNDDIERKSPSLHSNPEDMIEEVNDEPEEEPRLIMDVDETETKLPVKQERDRSLSPVPQRNDTPQQNQYKSLLDHMSEIMKFKSREMEERQSPFEVKQEEEEENTEVLQCSRCDKTFNHPTELVQHEKMLCSSLQLFNNKRQHDDFHVAAAAAAVNHMVNIGNNIPFISGPSGSEDDTEDRESKLSSESERKVRVRTAISEDQQTILKQRYAINARPSREEFRIIAEQLRLDPRVVQVWFQNNRSRERKLGNLGLLTGKSPQQPQVVPNNFYQTNLNLTPAKPMVPSMSEPEQPLDLTIKKESPNPKHQTPSNSPRYGTAPIMPDNNSHDEAINLSRNNNKQPKLDMRHSYPYQFNTPSDLMLRQIPSPSEAQTMISHRQSNPFMLPGNSLGLLPMERLLQFTPEMARNQLLNLKPSLDGNRCSISPSSSDKRSWKDDDSRVSYDDDKMSSGSAMGKRLYASSDIKEPPNSEGMYVCDLCDKAFHKQSSLARHKYEHSGQRPYKCVECPKAFKHKHHLTEHKRLHTGEKPFQCCKCLKKFSHSGSYSQHMNHRYSYCKPYRE